MNAQSELIKNKWFIFLVILLALASVRLLLPNAILYYVNHQFSRLPGYTTHINKIKLHLIRGEYEIIGLKVEKLEKNIPVPFFSADDVHLSLQWSALLQGSIVGEAIVNKPKLNFVVDPKGNEEQLTVSKIWQDIITHLFPVAFNQLSIHAGEVHYRSFNSAPPFDIYLNQLELTADNMQGVSNDSTLPALVHLTAITIGNGKVEFNVQFNSNAAQPLFDLNATLESLELNKAYNFFKHYTHLVPTSGTFSLYIEAAAKDGKVLGYAKPLIKHLNITLPKDQQSNPLNVIAFGVAKAGKELLKSSKTQAIASKITISGNINNPDAKLWTLIITLLQNAFLQSILPGIDDSIEPNDINPTKPYQVKHKD